jgi:signal transduction histidine kinase
MGKKVKLNCWEYRQCNLGPESETPCPAAMLKTSNGVNGGKNAGRLCWTVPNTPCFGKSMPSIVEKKKICFTCGFFHRVEEEEGDQFHLVQLAQGVKNSRELRTTLSKVEHIFDFHEKLNSNFDLLQTLSALTTEAKKITGAERSVVFLLKGNPPALHGHFQLRRGTHQVVVEVDENSVVGYAAAHNRAVNLHDLQKTSFGTNGPVFNRSFDEQCDLVTHSLLAVPVVDSEKRVIGVITAANAKKGFFSPDDEWFMRTYATEVALAVEKQKFLQQSISAIRLASIGETIAGLSHCIKNIAHALRGSSYIIKRAIDSDNVKDIKVAWEILDRHIENLANLSLDVLTYEPSSPAEKENGGFNEMVRHVVELYQEEAKSRAISLTMDLGESVDSFSFDERGIYRCLINLITNALDACPLSDGEVTVTTRRTGGKEILLVVSDNGRGIAKETKAEIFDLFKTSRHCPKAQR